MSSSDDDEYLREHVNGNKGFGTTGLQDRAADQASPQKTLRRKYRRNVRFEDEIRNGIGNPQSASRGNWENSMDQIPSSISLSTIDERQRRHRDQRDCLDAPFSQTAPVSHMNQAAERDVLLALRNLSERTSTDDPRVFFNLSVDLDDPPDPARHLTQRPAPVPNQHDSEISLERTEGLHIVLSSSSTDDRGQESIEFGYTDDVPQESFTHWQHIERQFMDLERFKELALQTPHVKASLALSTVVERFIDEVSKRFSRPSRQGKGALYGAVHSDVEVTAEDKFEKVAATWLCFPYLCKGDSYMHGIPTRESRGLCRTRTLFQWSYGNELFLEQEERQAFKEETGGLLYVPQVWILLLGKDTIVSSSPCSLRGLLPKKLKLQPITPSGRQSLLWVKLIDHLHREILVSSAHCESFQALQILVAETCLAGKQGSLEHYDLHVDGNRLTANLWLYFTRFAKSSPLEVWIKRKEGLSHDDSFSTSTQRSNRSKAPLTGLNVRFTEPNGGSALPSSPGTDQTPIRIEVEESDDSEDEQNRSFNDGVGARNREPVVTDAGMSDETGQITQTALSHVRPFLCWDPDRNDSAISLPNQEEKEKAMIEDVLSRIVNPQNRFSSSHHVPSVPSRQYLEADRYEKMATASFEKIEVFEAHHRDGPTATFPCGSNQSNAPANFRPEEFSKCRCLNCQNRQMILQIISSTKQIISLFVSSLNNHELLRKMWGALETLVSSNIAATPSSKHKHKLQRWTVLTSPDDVAEMRLDYDIPYPDRHPDRICKPCQSGKQYDTAAEAVRHLIRKHYAKSVTEGDKRFETLELLTATFEQVWTKRLQQAQGNLLKVLKDRLGILQRVAHDLKMGLATSIGDKHPSYMLPDSMIEAMRYLVHLILAAGHAATLIHSAYADWVPYEAEQMEPPRVHDYIDLVDGLGKDAEASILRAWEDIRLAIKDEFNASRKVYPRFGTKFTTSNLLQHLLERPVDHDQNTVELYAKIISELESHVFNDRPQRRLFGKIYLLQEDIRALVKVRKAQYSVLDNMRKVFDPAKFAAVEPTESVQCHLSLPAVQSAIESAQFDLNELDLMLEKSRDLERRAKHRIEILEEDHGKAIFVFTLVTAIFLPLSFVSSYMGMNTADIRDMGATQERFWAVAVPVTVTVMGAATFLAYKGDLIRKWLLLEAMQSTSGRESAKKEWSRPARTGEQVLRKDSFALGRSRDAKWWHSGKVEEAR